MKAYAFFKDGKVGLIDHFFPFEDGFEFTIGKDRYLFIDARRRTDGWVTKYPYFRKCIGYHKPLPAIAMTAYATPPLNLPQPIWADCYEIGSVSIDYKDEESCPLLDLENRAERLPDWIMKRFGEVRSVVRTVLPTFSGHLPTFTD